MRGERKREKDRERSKRSAPGDSTRRRANVAHITQPRPDSGLGFHVKVLEIFFSLLGNGCRINYDAVQKRWGEPTWRLARALSSFYLLLSSLELSNTQVYEH